MFFFVALSSWRCIKPRCMAMPSIHSIKILGRYLKSSSEIGRSRWSVSFRFAKLQFLDLTLATISTDCLSSLLSACRSLRKLSLETLPLNTAIFEWVHKDEDGKRMCLIEFRKLALNQHLDTLNLTMCTGIDLACCCILTGQMKQY